MCSPYNNLKIKLTLNKSVKLFSPLTLSTILSDFSVNEFHKNPSSYSPIHPRV